MELLSPLVMPLPLTLSALLPAVLPLGGGRKLFWGWFFPLERSRFHLHNVTCHFLPHTQDSRIYTSQILTRIQTFLCERIPYKWKPITKIFGAVGFPHFKHWIFSEGEKLFSPWSELTEVVEATEMKHGATKTLHYSFWALFKYQYLPLRL